MEVVPGLFNLRLAFNTGVAFSQLQFAPEVMRWVLTAFAIVVSAALMWWAKREDSLLFKAGASFIVGGALGNAIDRVYLGAVVDFLDFHIHHWHWPTFNVADSAICFGVLLLMTDSFTTKRKV